MFSGGQCTIAVGALLRCKTSVLRHNLCYLIVHIYIFPPYSSCKIGLISIVHLPLVEYSRFPHHLSMVLSCSSFHRTAMIPPTSAGTVLYALMIFISIALCTLSSDILKDSSLILSRHTVQRDRVSHRRPHFPPSGA